jgi:hypothetical protein
MSARQRLPFPVPRGAVDGGGLQLTGTIWHPCLYQGKEIEFMKDTPQDVIGNDDTLDSTGRAYLGDHLADENIVTTPSQPLYRHIQQLNQI